MREAKLQGDWTGPDEAYEAAARDFLFALLAPGSTFRRGGRRVRAAHRSGRAR